jgi:Tfp pilus assembly protein PilV
MSRLILNNKGITLIEVLIAFFLTVTAIIALMSMFSLAMQTSGKSDYMGRAVGILQQELEFREELVMHGSFPSTTPYTAPDQTIKVSGLTSSKEGDATFTVKTTMTKQGSYSWLVHVQVTWPGNSNGVKNSIIVTTQNSFL